MKKLLLVLSLTVLLTWCALKPQEAQRVTIKSVGTCGDIAGMKVCEITLTDGTTGTAQEYYAVPGNPIRSDMVH